ncbi:MAG: hypothetical protein JWM21_396 [Acidobacteria bacterium]|nr:hypothetical protein [Acidobacteriota bacterium]
MSTKTKEAVVVLVLLGSVLLGCNFSKRTNSNSSGNANSTTANTNTSVKPNADGTVPSGTGVEKEKPESGKANVQGKVFYNQQPATAVDVKLCEKFNQYFGGCQGETFATKTDAQGEYLIKNVPPRVYEGLIVKVFDTPFYVFATSGIVSTAKYKIDADQTFFAPDTNLFKNNLKLLNPKAGAKIGPADIELKWDAYPDAAYYKFSIYADSTSGAKTEYDYINKRVDGVSYALDKPLAPGAYRCKIEAFNGNDIKLAQSSDDINFTVTGVAPK